MFSSVLLIQNCLGAVGRACDTGHRKRTRRRRENVLNTNVKKGSPVDEKERRQKKVNQSEKTGFEVRFVENRSSSQDYLGKRQYPTKRMFALRRWMGRTGRLGKISMPRCGKDEAEPAEQHSPL